MKTFLRAIPIFLFFIAASTQLIAQCADNIILNGGFENGLASDWWNWHDNSPDSYTFELSNDAYVGDSSVVINILTSTDDIPGGQGAEYNSRPQTNPVVGGQFYEIKFYAKSTIDNTDLPIYVKDENDSWILLHSDVVTVGTDWTEVTSLYQADMDRADIHLEIKVYNGDFQDPYSVWIDEVSICPTEILTNTCADNIVANPGFEEGADNNWWTWHGGDETDYSFSTGMGGTLGNASAKLSVLKPSSELTGTGEFNSRPQVSPVVAGQNYKVTVIGKSTVESTIIQVWVKDEFDGWTTIGNSDLEIGTDWTEVSFIFENETDRDDVHLELKVFNADFTAPYDVWFDEVSVCATDEEPGDGGPAEPDPESYGSVENTTTCTVNLVEDILAEDMPNDGLGWDIWDGSDDDELSTFMLDPVLPYSGDNSVRIDVTENHDVAEFHHRFGNDLVLEDGKDYTVSLWIRSNVAAGDTVRVYTRAVRDTDWTSQFALNNYTVSNQWKNYSYTFTSDGTWDNAFLEMKIWRWNAFTAPYSVWMDDIQLCSAEDAITAVENLENLGLSFNMSPNPVMASDLVNLSINADSPLSNTNIQLIDVLGRQLWSNQIDIFAGTQHIQIPTKGLSNGIYYVNINHDGYHKNLKLQVIN